MDTQPHNRRLRRRGLSVGRLRHWLIYKPLAVLLVILLMPALPWIGGASAPYQVIFEQFGFTVDRVVAAARASLSRVGAVTGSTTGT